MVIGVYTNRWWGILPDYDSHPLGISCRVGGRRVSFRRSLHSLNGNISKGWARRVSYKQAKQNRHVLKTSYTIPQALIIHSISNIHISDVVAKGTIRSLFIAWKTWSHFSVNIYSWCINHSQRWYDSLTQSNDKPEQVDSSSLRSTLSKFEMNGRDLAYSSIHKNGK